RAAIKRLARRRAARLGDRPGQSADRGERRVGGAGLAGPRAGAGQGQVADHSAGADDLPGRVRMGDQAGGGAIDYPSADDRCDPDRDDDRPPAGAARAASRRGRHVSAVLELDRLSLSFGGLRALSELDLQGGEREVVRVIGPNGAGKTTVFNVITGVYEPSAGDVRFSAQPGSAESIAGRPPHAIARLGVARTFQTLRLFMNMSVLENVMTATYGGTKAMPWESGLRLPGGLGGGAGGGVAGAAAGPPRGTRGPGAGRGRAVVLRPATRRVPLGPAGLLAVLREQAAAGDPPGAGHPAEAAAAGRAGRRDEPGRDARGHRADRAARRRARGGDPGHRARHARGVRLLGPGGRARPRRQDRR